MPKNYKIEKEESSTLLDRQIISEYARTEGVSVVEAKRRLNAFIETMRNLVIDGNPVSLRRFGRFYTTKRKGIRFKNNKTGQIEEAPATKVIRFKPAVSLKRELNVKVKSKLLKALKDNKSNKE
jgi:nucleoid DNA-binding protein